MRFEVVQLISWWFNLRSAGDSSMTRSSLKEIHPTHLPLASAPAELRHLCLSENLGFHLGCPLQDHLRMNVAPDQTIDLGP